MKPEVLNPCEYPNTLVVDKFLHLDGFFYLNYECIFTDNKIVKPLKYYDLIEFLDDGSIVVKHVKFYHAVLKNDVLKIICLQPSTQKILHRCHVVNDDNIPCDWLLLPKDYFKDDLLEFEF